MRISDWSSDVCSSDLGRIDHQLIRLTALCRKAREDLVEYTQPAPADEAVVDRLWWTVFRRRIAPPQAVPDHEDDTADDPAVIDPRHAVRQWEMRLKDRKRTRLNSSH